MKNIRIIIVLVVFPFFCIIGQNQQSLPEDRPIIPPSPRAAAFHIYGDYPVNYNTGIADISIPLYTVKMEGIEVPITLRYHHAGVKFYETQLSNVATGWIIDVGGLVSRTIMGKPDKRVPMFNVDSLEAGYLTETDEEDFKILQRLACGQLVNTVLDSEYDIFSYRFNDNVGKFVVGRFDEVIKFPHNSLKIEPEWAGHLIQKIDIYDDKGVQYRFGKSLDGQSKAVEYTGSNFESSWLLTGIKPSHGKDSIVFKYRDASRNGSFTYKIWVPNHFVEIKDGRQGDEIIEDVQGTHTYFGDSYAGSSIECLVYNGYRELLYNIKTISEIIFPLGKIVFNSIDGGERVSSIDIFDNRNELLRSVRFNTTAFDESGRWNALSSVEFLDSRRVCDSRYLFEYNDVRFPQVEHTNALDYWGYYNGCNDNTSLIPNFYLTFKRNQVKNGAWGVLEKGLLYNYTIGFCDRTPSEYFAQAYILEKIVYPTGGFSEFEYQLNRYGEDNKPGGGLRIHRIINDDGKGNKTSRSYEYSPGVLELMPDSAENYIHEADGILFQMRTENQGFIRYHEFSFRKRFYSSDMNGALTLGTGNQIRYPEVIEYIGTNEQNIGRNVYRFEEHRNLYTRSRPNNDLTFPRLHTWRRWKSGNLIETLVQRQDEIGNWVSERIIRNEYELLSRTKLRNLSVTKTTFYPPSFVRIGSLSTTDLDDLILTPDLFERLDLIYGRFEHSRSFPFFLQDRYLIDTSTPVLSETIDSLWTDNGNFVKNESYAYDSIYLKPISIVQTTSDGEMLEIKNEYVFSDAYKNEDPYKGMIKNNIVSPIIERQEYKKKFENVLLSTQKLSYKQFYPKVFKPSEFMISFESNPFYLKSKYSRYDSHGNPLCITSDDLTTIYLWGYSYQYPVAEIKNASWEQVESIIGDAEAFAAAEIPDEMLLARLRTELPSAQVTVYTYEPLVGITSSTDPRGHTTYYEYDDAGRLVRVKEGEKTTTLYKYHYRNE